MTTMEDIQKFSTDLACAHNERAAFELFEVQSRTKYSHILFTVLRFDYHESAMSRLYSNREDISPTGGTKPMPTGVWADQIIAGGRAYIGRNREDLRDVFFDYEALWAIGCESVLNVPVRWLGKTVGSMNILGRENQFTEEDGRRFAVIAQLGSPLFLESCDHAKP